LSGKQFRGQTDRRTDRATVYTYCKAASTANSNRGRVNVCVDVVMLRPCVCVCVWCQRARWTSRRLWSKCVDSDLAWYRL